MHTKFGQSDSFELFSFHDIEWKRNSDVTQGPQLHQNFAKTNSYNRKLGLVNVDVHTKFGQILSSCSRDIERKTNF